MKKAKIKGLLLLLPVLVGLLVTGVSQAWATGPAKQTIRIHKMQYTTLPEKMPNTGGEMTDFPGTGLAGVGFSVYDVTSAYWTAYAAASGDNEAKTANAMASLLATPASGTPVATTPLTDGDGVADLALPLTSSGKNAVYRFVETVRPAGVVGSQTEDFILGLPVHEEATQQLRNLVHVYPKNVIKELTLAFTKYGVNPTGATTPLAGATFYLTGPTGKLYNTETAAFDLTFSDPLPAEAILTANAAGLVSLPALPLLPGDYTFTEMDSSVAKAGLQANDSLLFHYKTPAAVVAHVTSEMTVTYSYYDLQGNLLKDRPSAVAYNYQVPPVEKTVDDDEVDRGQVVTYTISSVIPQDIRHYSLYQFVDSYSDTLALVADETAIKDSLRYGGVSASGIATSFAATVGSFSLTFSEPEQLVPYAGKTLTFDVKMQVLGDTLGEIENQVTFKNDFTHRTARKTIKTYGKVFRKKDAYTQEALAGAKFVLKNAEGQYLQLFNGPDKLAEVTGLAKGYDVKWTTNKGEASFLLSDAAGDFGVYGLSGAGTYQLEEITAPAGYVLSQGTVPVTADSGKTRQTIFNKPKGTLPATGGVGMLGFGLLGLMMISGTLWYFRKEGSKVTVRETRKRRK